MNNLFLIAKLDVKESFRSRWFAIYALLFFCFDDRIFI